MQRKKFDFYKLVQLWKEEKLVPLKIHEESCEEKPRQRVGNRTIKFFIASH
jgi:hypothetical protein